jgi:hypothetical protein
MRLKFAIPALVIASLIGLTSISFAQMQPAPGASSEGNVGPGAGSMRSPEGMTSRSGMTDRSGMTTGSASSRASRTGMGDAARNPSSEGNVGPGTNNNSGPAPGGR